MNNTFILKKEQYNLTEDCEVNYFKDIDSFQEYLRNTNKIPDLLVIQNIEGIKNQDILFTIESYDQAGKLITYGNKKYVVGLWVNTSNRYENSKFSDAEVYSNKMDWFRNDINYRE